MLSMVLYIVVIDWGLTSLWCSRTNYSKMFCVLLIGFGLLSQSTCNSCGIGFYSYNGRCKQCPNNCTSCDSESPCTTCANNDFGNSCSAQCSHNCILCVVSSGTCEMCQAGFFIDEIYSCKRCPNNCRYCLSENNCLDCMNGYKGLTCHEKCLNCKPNTRCGLDDGYCFEGCKSGLTGPMCNITCDSKCNSCHHLSANICTSCAEKRYGKNCDDECSKTCYEGICNVTNGFCVGSCETGYWGNKCEFACSLHCLNHECERRNGNCKYGCVNGYTGNTCLSAHNCNCDLPGISCKSCKEVFMSMCDHICDNVCVGKTCQKEDCLNVCNNSYNGTNCANTSGDSSSAISPNMAIIGLVVGLACLIIIVSNIITRAASKRKRLSENEEDILNSRNTKVSDLYMTSLHGNTYYNTTEPRKRAIDIRKLAVYVQTMTVTEYVLEFEQLPQGLINSFTESQKEENLSKNSYIGIYPYDVNRVILKSKTSDYINASYIDGYDREKAYIALSGPSTKHIDDISSFWEMVWQQKCGKIVTLTNEAECQDCQFWPNGDLSGTFRDIVVSCQNENTSPNHSTKTFDLKKGNKKRSIDHFQFTGWRENWAPEDMTTLVEFRQQVNHVKTEISGPVLVHCSDGVGRTGTYIAFDILAREAEGKGCVDIFSCVRHLREQRAQMVRTADQYVYLHRVLVYSLTMYTQLSDISARQCQNNLYVESLSDTKDYLTPVQTS